MPATPEQDFQLDWLASQARLRIREAQERIESVRGRCADRDDLAGVVLLTQTLTLMVAQALRLIEEQVHRARERPDKEDIPLSTIRQALQLTDVMVWPALEALVLPPERDMTSLVQPYIRLARAVTRSDSTELIFGTQESYDYQVWPNLFDEVEKQVSELAPGLETTINKLPQLAQIEYPARADSETFMHAVVAHEVAHLALERPSPDTQFATELERIFEKHRAESAFSGLARADEQVRRLHHWFRELTCDSLGLRLVGPSFVLGLIEYLLPALDANYDYETLLERQEREDVHPPPAWRLHRLRDPARAYFRAEGPMRRTGTIRQARTQLDRYYSLVHADDFGTGPTASPAATERTFLEAALGEIVSDLDGWINDARYTRGTFQRDLPLIWDKLDQGIAPAERVAGRRQVRGGVGETDAPRDTGSFELPAPSSDWSEPTDWRSILNGGYLYHLHQAAAPDRPSTETARRHRSREYSNSLIRGSIELSEMHRQMLELRQQFDWLNEPRIGAS